MLIIYFRAAEAWVLGGIPHIKHTNYQNFYLYIIHRLYISAKELASIGYKLHSSLIN